MSDKPSVRASHNAQDLISLREYFDVKLSALSIIVDERDRQYGNQFKASETAVAAALAAAKEAVAAAFVAAEKAVLKAEEAQKDYNVRSNEFRGQLDDQAKTLMPRTESAVISAGLDSKIDAVTKTLDSKINVLQLAMEGKVESMRLTNEKTLDATKAEIANLREYRASNQGSSELTHWVVPIMATIAGIVVAVFAVVTR